MKDLLFLIVLFVSNVIQAITGFAGTVLAMPPSAYLLGLDHAKVVLNAMAWLSGLLIAVTGLVMAVRDRRPAVLPKLAASCIPCIVYLAVYLVLV